jgi:enterochelin esterase family protein
VEFKLKAPSAKKVQLVGAFIVRGGRKEMARGEGGVWTLTLYLTPNTYRYHFTVDGKRLSDPENPASSLVVKPQ